MYPIVSSVHKKIKQCQKLTGCQDNDDYKTICLDNHKAWNNKTPKCHLLFKQIVLNLPGTGFTLIFAIIKIKLRLFKA